MRAAFSPRGRSRTCNRTRKSSRSTLDGRAPTLAAKAAALPPGGARPALGRPGARPVADAPTAALEVAAPLLKVHGLNQYYGGSHILRNVALEAARGEGTVILRRHGVGKTTLLKSLMGVVPVRSGSVSFGGVDITGETPYQRARRGVGYVPQGREIFARLTVEENLNMGLAYRPGRSRLAPELFELFPVLKQM